uniref:Uncharacterized protein n=1 Tax=Leersia perrieri TaxID=77586 RepID=A0A0D9V3X7_9ORYZ
MGRTKHVLIFLPIVAVAILISTGRWTPSPRSRRRPPPPLQPRAASLLRSSPLHPPASSPPSAVAVDLRAGPPISSPADLRAGLHSSPADLHVGLHSSPSTSTPVSTPSSSTPRVDCSPRGRRRQSRCSLPPRRPSLVAVELHARLDSVFINLRAPAAGLDLLRRGPRRPPHASRRPPLRTLTWPRSWDLRSDTPLSTTGRRYLSGTKHWRR